MVASALPLTIWRWEHLPLQGRAVLHVVVVGSLYDPPFVKCGLLAWWPTPTQQPLRWKLNRSSFHFLSWLLSTSWALPLRSCLSSPALSQEWWPGCLPACLPASLWISSILRGMPVKFQALCWVQGIPRCVELSPDPQNSSGIKAEIQTDNCDEVGWRHGPRTVEEIKMSYLVTFIVIFPVHDRPLLHSHSGSFWSLILEHLFCSDLSPPKVSPLSLPFVSCPLQLVSHCSCTQQAVYK